MDFDVVVLGGGPGGYAAALYGASAGLSVAMVEKDTIGGTCLQRGCIPAKALLQAAEVYRTIGHAGDFGFGVPAGTTVPERVAVIGGGVIGAEFAEAVVAQRNGPILGVLLVGAWASELLAEGYLAVNWEALPGDVGAFIHPHSSLSEALGETMITFSGRSLHG